MRPARARLTGAALAVAVLVGLAGCGDPGPTAGDPSSTAPASPSGTAQPTSSEDLPQWESFNTVDIPRDDFGTSVVGSDIWIMGGMTGSVATG